MAAAARLYCIFSARDLRILAVVGKPFVLGMHASGKMGAIQYVKHAWHADVGERVSRGAGGGSAQRSPHASGACIRACCRCPYKMRCMCSHGHKKRRCTYVKQRDRQHNRRRCSSAAASSVVWPSTRRRASASLTSRPSSGRPLVPRFDPRTSTQPADRSDTPPA